MEKLYKEWKTGDIYNIYVEFARLENYNKYVKSCLKGYGVNISQINSTTTWTIETIPDINDYNRIKKNLNYFLTYFGENTLSVGAQLNQVFTMASANDLENAVKKINNDLGDLQLNSSHRVCGLNYCGSNASIVNVL